MTSFQRRAAKGLAAGSFAVAATSGAVAQDTASEIQELKTRVAELEAKQGKDAGAGGDVKWSELSALGSKFQLYGYLRLDAIYDDSRPNNTQVVAFIRSEDPTAPAGFRAKNNSSDFNMHPKLTRLGLNFTGPTIADLGDAQVLGKLEIDFYNATATESREALRIRLAYAQLKWSEVNFYAGQMWDVISPLFPIVNPDFVMWGAGNLGDRRPQARLEWSRGETTRVTLTGMLGGTGADDAQDLDGNGYRDGDQAAFPTLQARAGVKQPVGDWKSPLEFGVWVHRANEEVDAGTAGVGGERNFVSAAYGIDLQVPVWQDRVWVKGELWHGRNLDDVRGAILQGINTAGQEISSTGGFGEVGYKLFPDSTRVSLHGGYSWDNPDNDDLIVSATNAPRSRNSIWYAAIRFDFKPVYFGFDYLHWVTGYKGFDQGDDNRFQAFIQYSF
jgi:hypothetical protein